MAFCGRQPVVSCASRGAGPSQARPALHPRRARGHHQPGWQLGQALQVLRSGAVPRAGESQSFVTAEERARFTPDQLEFLERKRRAAAGLGPIMPQGSLCPACNGRGQCTCHQCNGTGTNEREGEEILQGDEQGMVIENNGVGSSKWFFMKGGPCWLCRGAKEVGCPDCHGTGFKGGMEAFTGD